MIKITIPHTPIPKARHRDGRTGKYDPQSKEKESIKTFVKLQLGNNILLTGPLFVQSIFYLERPKSHFGTGRNKGKLKPSAPNYHIKKPDIDNFVKFYYDVFNGIVWKDDSQVVSEFSIKDYCMPDESPRVEIIIKNCKE